MAVLVGFPYKNLSVTLAFPLHLLSPTVSEANREGRTDYYRLGFSLELYVAWLKLVLMLPDGLEK
jgi:hypothetical protein